METAAFFIALLGCADDGSLCTEQRRAAPRFATYQACAAAMEAELARASDIPFPMVEARCQRKGPQMVGVETTPRG